MKDPAATVDIYDGHDPLLHKPGQKSGEIDLAETTSD